MKRLMFLAIVPLSLCLVQKGRAEDRYSAHGFVIEANLPYSAIHGDLNGTDILLDEEELLLVPRFSSGSGYGFGFGWNGGGTMILLRYYRTSHKTSFLIDLPEGLTKTEGGGTAGAVGLKFQGHFARSKPLQPYIMMGIDVPWVTARDAGVTASDVVGDVRFLGAGLEFGLVFTVKPTSKIHISAGPVFRGMLLGWVKGPSGAQKDAQDMMLNEWQAKLSGGLWNGGVGFEVSAGYTF